MKLNNILIAVSLFSLFVTTSGCKKKIYGCMDKDAENYSNVANLDDGSCFYYENEIIVSNIIENVSWVQDGNSWYVSLTWGEITNNVINNGAVSVYMSDSNAKQWIELPFTTYFSPSYSTTFLTSYSEGLVEVYCVDSDLVLPDYPGTASFKIVVYK
jgi:hypothetical protein